jgi:hypothetical protein
VFVLLYFAADKTGKDVVSWHSQSLSEQADNQVLASRLALLSKIFAVDDALLYSSVRRAIEDRGIMLVYHLYSVVWQISLLVGI